MASSRPDAPRPNPRPEAPRPENPLPREVGVGCRIVREELGQTVKNGVCLFFFNLRLPYTSIRTMIINSCFPVFFF